MDKRIKKLLKDRQQVVKIIELLGTYSDNMEPYVGMWDFFIKTISNLCEICDWFDSRIREITGEK